MDNYAIFKPREVMYCQWNDNIAEMKLFCRDECIITYEYGPGLDCFFSLVIGGCIVPLHDYVVKIGGKIKVYSPKEFSEIFEKVENK